MKMTNSSKRYKITKGFNLKGSESPYGYLNRQYLCEQIEYCNLQYILKCIWNLFHDQPHLNSEFCLYKNSKKSYILLWRNRYPKQDFDNIKIQLNGKANKGICRLKRLDRIFYKNERNLKWKNNLKKYCK